MRTPRGSGVQSRVSDKEFPLAYPSRAGCPIPRLGRGVSPLRTPRASGVQSRVSDAGSPSPVGIDAEQGKSSAPPQLRHRRRTRTDYRPNSANPQCKIEVKNPGPLLAATCRSLHRRIPIPSAPLWCAVRAREAFAPLSAPVCYNEWDGPIASRGRHLRPHSR